MTLDVSFLPQLTETEHSALTWEEFTVRDVALRAPVATPDLVTTLTTRLRDAHRIHLADRPVMNIIDTLGRVQTLWADPAYPLRRTAEDLLPRLTGYASLHVRRTLRDYLATFRRDRLLRFLAQDFPDPGVLDGFRPSPAGGRRRARGPAVLTQIFAGNVPGLPAWDLVCALLVKSATLGKPASGEPLFASLFARSLAEVDAGLASCLAVLPWAGGDTAVEAAAFVGSDAVVATGSRLALADLRTRVPEGVRLIEHGATVSVAVIATEALGTDRYGETARRLARDVAHYDQQACLSPHVVYIETTPPRSGVSIEVFAAAVATELAAIERRSPRARFTLEEAAAWANAREAAELATWDDDTRSLLTAGDGSPWAVTVEPLDTPFEASPLGRFVRIVPVTGASAIEGCLAGVRRFVQSAGLACAPARAEEFADVLAASGVDRVAALGRMGAPAPGWHHDGRGSLGDLVTWTDLEPSVDADLDLYDPDDRSGG
ncbi:acyl-CoA reductase [Brevibacterium yomogidense]|uniref:acyl-CoA reductase n=1 Tax=Brevibacterium yomogidense TaxID=946573 RepID=UPI0018DF4EC7|nr:acyl-CoA reductase [Brevibacterium yomogidense]